MNNNQKYNTKEKVIIYSFSSLIGIISTFLFMLLSSLFMVIFEFNIGVLPIVSSFCLMVGSFVAGFLSAKKIGSKGILCGIVVSVIIFAFVFIVSLLLDSSGITLNTLIHFIINLLSSLIGGIIGVNKSAKFIWFLLITIDFRNLIL